MDLLNLTRRVALAGALALSLTACGQAAKQEEAAPARTEFTIGWTIYAGWMPWPYAEQAGIVKKWADRYGLTLHVTQVNDYVESLNQFTAGRIDAVTSTTMDALTVPAAGGTDTSVIIIGDYSNGNDGIILKGPGTLAAIKGRSVNLVELSVSHYLLARGLESVNLQPSDVHTVNTSDADIVAAYAAPATTALVAWNPQLAAIHSAPRANMVFDSSAIPGEILDTLIVRTEALQSNPNLGRALAGIWYETMALMNAQTPEGAAARAAMGQLSGTDQAGYEAQLRTTAMYYTAPDALAFYNSPDLVTATNRVRQFSFANGLFGQGATSVDAIGITFPGGQTQGDQANIKLRFDPSYTEMAAQGQLAPQ
jgi:NitT/TauT family transport system substrate-binding protein